MFALISITAAGVGTAAVLVGAFQSSPLALIVASVAGCVMICANVAGKFSMTR